ncbi:MAG: leucyl/phenylalanyl-tRNA--protein transferase, partial [Pseudomonadota bacterium]
MTLHWLGIEPSTVFPPLSAALDEPNGLLAAGGDLSPERLLAGYQRGIFPWYSEGQPILWWSPDPRMVLLPGQFHASRSLRKHYRQRGWVLTVNTAFTAVVQGCARPRRGEDGTWITPAMIAAYQTLHSLGWAHSFEVWLDDTLVGGLYGVAIDRVFFGESMYSSVTDASKIALWQATASLTQAGFQ